MDIYLNTTSMALFQKWPFKETKQAVAIQRVSLCGVYQKYEYEELNW